MNSGITWSPGIGDPDWIGWLITIAYFAAAVLCLRRYREGVWLGVGIFMLFLGFNKQLDLQELLREIGRQLALHEGWYAQRQVAKTAFAAATAGVVATSLMQLFRSARRQSRWVKLSLFGAAVSLAFVMMRVATFENVIPDKGENFNGTFELGGILLVALGNHKDTKTRRASV